MSHMRPDQITAIVFDKDGTLFDFRATWEAWAANLIRDLADGDDDLAQAIAARLEFDLAAGAFAPSSFVIAGTNAEVAEALCEVLDGPSFEQILARILEAAKTVPLVPVTDLPALLSELRRRGLKLAVMTNDSEAVAHAHLNAAGIADQFDAVLGADSGHGAKPDAAPLLAACAHMGCAPKQAAMVGDSTHDLEAGRAAGMMTVAVLTGIARAPELAPHADVVLADISELPNWLDS